MGTSWKGTDRWAMHETAKQAWAGLAMVYALKLRQGNAADEAALTSLELACL